VSHGLERAIGSREQSGEASLAGESGSDVPSA